MLNPVTVFNFLLILIIVNLPVNAVAVACIMHTIAFIRFLNAHERPVPLV